MRAGPKRSFLIAALLTLSVAAHPWPAHARVLLASATPAPDVGETVVFGAIRDSVTRLQNVLHHKVASVLTTKLSDCMSGDTYQSTWQVTVKYWLDYAKPEDVPYFAGVQRCLAEFRPTASKEWTAWAESQVSQARSKYAEEIAFQQQTQMKVLVQAALDSTGKVIPSTVKVFHVVSDTETVSLSAETLAVPGDKQMEQAGYRYLKDRLDAGSAPPSTGGTASSQSGAQSKSPSQSGTSSPSSSAPVQPSVPTAPAVGASRWGSASTESRILLIGIAALAGLILVLIVNQYLIRRPRR